MIRITAFRSVPPFAQGLVRDLRVRWALEEAGLPYVARLIGPPDQKSAEYRSLQPFGQVPVLEEDGLVLFESGAIVLHVAERCEALLPRDTKGRARAITWLFCALNTVEPQVQQLATIDLFHPAEDWARQRRAGAEDAVRQRLAVLTARLRDREYLEDHFSAGDLMMATVLRILRHTTLVTGDPVLAAYLARCQARPAFQRALAAQMEPFGQPDRAAVVP